MKTKTRAPWVHTPSDGRGRRVVLLNGKEIKHVFFADTKKGVVRFYAEPIRVHKHGKRIIERTRKGRVVVNAA